MICDFCSSPDPQWECPCGTYDKRKRETHPLKEWLACDICVTLILHRKWNALAARSMEESPTGQLMEDMFGEETALAKIQEHHREYRKHSSGEPRRIEVKQDERTRNEAPR